MSRIFLSHSSNETLQAVALKKWLVDQNPPLAEDIFLDVDPTVGLHAGDRWKDALTQATARCEAVICLWSKSWHQSTECRTEFRTAEQLGKRIIPALLEEPEDEDNDLAEHHWVSLFGAGAAETIEFEWNGKQHVIEFPGEGLRALRDAIVDRGIGADTFLWPPPNDPERDPYRGWNPLDEADAGVFFGRDSELVRALDALRSMRKGPKALFVIQGPSGAGKSSFLRAGLMPRLRREDRNFTVLDVVRPESSVLLGENGLAESVFRTAERLKIPRITRAEVKKACLDDSVRLSEILSVIHQTAADRTGGLDGSAKPPTLLLPVDQAEELFNIDKQTESIRFDEAGRFLDLLGQNARADLGYRIPLVVIMTIRTDRSEALQTAEQLSRVESEVFADLRPMPPDAFREVIMGPARRATRGGRALFIEEQLRDRLVRDCTKGADTLPLLSLTLSRLYKDYGGDGDLRLDEYLDMGEMSQVVQKEVNSVLSGVKETRERQLVVLREAFIPWLASINPENEQPVRKPARWNDFPPAATPLLREFVDRRLLVTGSDEDRVEIALDGFLEHWDELKGWLNEERETLTQVELLKRNAKEWKDSNKDSSYLLEGQRLAAAEPLLQSRFGRNVSEAAEFVACSREREDVRNRERTEREKDKEAARRRMRTLRAVVAAAVVISLVAGISIYALLKTQRTKFGLQLVTRSEQMLDGGRRGGDILALQQLLAARSLGASTADSVANRSRDLLKIMENPPSQGDEPVTGVEAVAISPPSDDPDAALTVAAANDDHTVRVWDTATGRVRHTLSVARGVPLSVAYSPDGRWVAAGTDEGIVYMWDSGSGELQGNPIGQDDQVVSVAFSPDGRYIATGGSKGGLRVWRVGDGGLVIDPPMVKDLGGGHVRVVAFRPRPQRIDSGSGDPAILPDILLSGNDDGWVQLWNVQTGQPLSPPKQFRIRPNSASFAVGLENDIEKPRIAIGFMDGMIQVFDGNTLDSLSAPTQAHPDMINSVALSTGGTRLVSGGTDNAIQVWAVGADPHRVLTPIGTPLTGHHGHVTAVAFNNLGTQIISGARDGSVRVWNAVTALPIPADGTSAVNAVAFNPHPSGDMAEMASAGGDGVVKLWNPATATQYGQLGVPSGDDSQAVNALAYSPDGKRIVTGDRNGVLRLWELSSLQQNGGAVPASQAREAQTGGEISSLAFNSDGTRIVTGVMVGRSGMVELWDGAALKPQGRQPTDAQVWSVAFSPDDRLVATGTGLRTGSNLVQLWSVDPLSPEADPLAVAPQGGVMALAFDKHGGTVRLAAAGNDGVTRIWDIGTRKQEWSLISGDQNRVNSIAFAHNQPQVVSGGADGRVRLWDSETNEPLGTPMDGGQRSVNGVAFSPDDKWVASAGGDGTLHLWPTPEGDLPKVVCPKIGSNMSREQWRQFAPWWLPYTRGCPDLPVPD